MKKQYFILLIAIGFLTFISACKNESGYKTLIITGQNNHEWKTSSPILKQILDETGLFSSEVMITPEKGGDMKKFDPDFSFRSPHPPKPIISLYSFHPGNELSAA